MDSLNLWIAVAGLLLGLISAWPRLIRWFNSARNIYSARAKRTASKRILRLKLAAADPSYLIAYITGTSALGFFFFWLGTLTKAVPVADAQLQLALLVGRLGFSLIAGGLIGNVLGLVIVTVWQKESAARSGG